jgi:hypothetical protein
MNDGNTSRGSDSMTLEVPVMSPNSSNNTANYSPEGQGQRHILQFSSRWISIHDKS